MTVTAAAFAALPASLLAIWVLRMTPAARHVVAAPRADRWHTRSTPLLGGSGIFTGMLVASGIAVATHVIPASREASAASSAAAPSSSSPASSTTSFAYRRSRSSPRRAAPPRSSSGRASACRSSRTASLRPRSRSLASRDDERVQPARQHGRARGVARDDRMRVLRDRRVHDPPRPHGRPPRARRLLRMPRLPALQPPPAPSRVRVHGRSGSQAPASSWRARPRVELDRRRLDGRDVVLLLHVLAVPILERLL